MVYSESQIVNLTIKTMWAEIQYENVKLALVSPAEHPPLLLLHSENVKNGKKHRDGSESTYEHTFQAI